MSKNKSTRNRLSVSADKVQMKSKVNGITDQNQNQGHNTQKQALGPNTER